MHSNLETPRTERPGTSSPIGNKLGSERSFTTSVLLLMLVLAVALIALVAAVF